MDTLNNRFSLQVCFNRCSWVSIESVTWKKIILLIPIMSSTFQKIRVSLSLNFVCYGLSSLYRCFLMHRPMSISYSVLIMSIEAKIVNSIYLTWYHQFHNWVKLFVTKFINHHFQILPTCWHMKTLVCTLGILYNTYNEKKETKC